MLVLPFFLFVGSSINNDGIETLADASEGSEVPGGKVFNLGLCDARLFRVLFGDVDGVLNAGGGTVSKSTLGVTGGCTFVTPGSATAPVVAAGGENFCRFAGGGVLVTMGISIRRMDGSVGPKDLV